MSLGSMISRRNVVDPKAKKAKPPKQTVAEKPDPVVTEAKAKKATPPAETESSRPSLRYVCPKCKAKAGVLCVTAHGNDSSWPHSARIKLVD